MSPKAGKPLKTQVPRARLSLNSCLRIQNKLARPHSADREREDDVWRVPGARQASAPSPSRTRPYRLPVGAFYPHPTAASLHKVSPATKECSPRRYLQARSPAHRSSPEGYTRGQSLSRRTTACCSRSPLAQLVRYAMRQGSYTQQASPELHRLPGWLR